MNTITDDEPKLIRPARKRHTVICTACDKPILPTGECAGCSD